MLGRERLEAVSHEALYLPTLSHLLIVNKLFSLSLSSTICAHHDTVLTPPTDDDGRCRASSFNVLAGYQRGLRAKLQTQL
jgi:hypothetical protein